MGMSVFYGPAKPEEDMIALIHHAISSGITLLDTSDIYGPFTIEVLIGKDLKGGWREKVQLVIKFGNYVNSDGKYVIRGDPAYVRQACEASWERLGVNCISLYYVHRIDTTVPTEITMGELKKLVAEGKIKYVGLSEASPSTIRRAHAVHPITAVELEWSLWTQDVEEELGIGMVAYRPLGRGFFSYGPSVVENLAKDDYRQMLLRFQAENLEHNKSLFKMVDEMAEKKGCTTAQLALACVHHRGDDVCPIPGTTKIVNVDKNEEALSVELTPEEMGQLKALVGSDAVKSDIYGGTSTTFQDSETPPLSSRKTKCVVSNIQVNALLDIADQASKKVFHCTEDHSTLSTCVLMFSTFSVFCLYPP